MRHSTAPMNREESAYVEACKGGFCIACLIREESAAAPPFFVPTWGCDFHHMKSGNVRIGHLWGIGLCRWHHERHPLEGWTHAAMGRHFGPSLKDGSATFHATYGSDADLLSRQGEALRELGIEPPVRPENRRWAK